MIPWIIKQIGDPGQMIFWGWVFVASYYICSTIVINENATENYKGFFRKNGAFDIITSVVWTTCALILIVSLVDLLVRNELSFLQLLNYYVLLILFFAFIYNLCQWHNSTLLAEADSNPWIFEIQCLLMSIQAMSTASYTSLRPKHLGIQALSTFQTLLGLVFISVFVAKAVNAFHPH